ncbi:hypothetical protein [Nitrosomonas communis]|nr:hypothetical protein [Nitrosomonas communis]AKH38830.1 hypothetical protein AAW31_15100 [Nitrosomonas communis]
MDIFVTYQSAADWLNNNQGVLGLLIFVFTLLLGWVSGIFSALRRKPKFKINLIDGPTYCCTYLTGKSHRDYEVHRTGIVLYLSIANVSSSASRIERISVGYHWHLRPFSSLWMRNTLGWFWLTDQAIALEDFQVRIGKSIKVYPFLIQRNNLSPVENKTYLEVGSATSGVVYFEQADSWGGCFPSIQNGQVKVKVKIEDVFGRSHLMIAWIPAVSFEDACKFNPSFGKTLANLHRQPLSTEQI